MSLKFSTICLNCDHSEKFKFNTIFFFNNSDNYITDYKEPLFSVTESVKIATISSLLLLLI